MLLIWQRVNPWACPLFIWSDAGLLLSTILTISVNLAFSLPLSAIKWDRLIIAPMCLHSSLTLTQARMHTWTHTHSDAIIALADDCSEHDCAVKDALQIHFPKTINAFGFLAWHSHSTEKRLLLGPKQVNWEMSLCEKACSVVIIVSSDQERATTIVWPKR